MKFGWKTRIGLVLSAVWLCLVIVISDDHQRTSQVLGLGVLPLVVVWGIVWAAAGWLAQRPSKPEAALLEDGRKRRDLIRSLIASLAVLGLGLFAATTQFEAAGVTTRSPVAAWFGEWLVWGLVAYVFLRMVPRLPAGAPAVLTVLLIVGAVNYKAYTAIAEEGHARDSLAKAAPLINKMQAGTPPSEQEVRDARVGMMEPLMLAQATYSQELVAIATTYRRATDNLQPELMLTPESLASPSIRVQTRAKLKLWHQATIEYKSQLDASTARGRLAVRAAESQMPGGMSGSASKGFDESAGQLAEYVAAVMKTEREASESIVGVLDLMDTAVGRYGVDSGPPVNLRFRDASTLAKYRELFEAVVAAAHRQQEAETRLLQVQADRAAKLGSLFKP